MYITQIATDSSEMLKNIFHSNKAGVEKARVGGTTSFVTSTSCNSNVYSICFSNFIFTFDANLSGEKNVLFTMVKKYNNV